MTGWPEGRPRVLVTDAWLPNAGDGAIALAIDRMVRELAPDAALLHAAYGSRLTAGAYPGFRFVPTLATLLGVEGSLPAPPDWPPPSGPDLVDGADLIVSQGGGFLLEQYQPWERLFALSAAVERGRPVVLLGQTIGAFSLARARSLLRRILRAARAVAVRDVASYAYARELGADPQRLVLTSDPSLTLFADDSATPGISRAGVGVVLTTHDESLGALERRQTLAHTILAEVVAKVGSEPVVLTSTVQGLGAAGLVDDRIVAQAAVNALPPQRRSTITVDGDRYLGPSEAIARFGSFRAVVTQRLHPALLALAQGVPAALLLSADKVGTLDGAGLGPLVCRKAEDAAARAEALDAALGGAAPRDQQLRDVLRPVFARSLLNIEVLARVLDDLHRV